MNKLINKYPSILNIEDVSKIREVKDYFVHLCDEDKTFVETKHISYDTPFSDKEGKNGQKLVDSKKNLRILEKQIKQIL